MRLTAERQRLVEDHLWLARYLSYRRLAGYWRANASISREECLSIAYYALCRAAYKHDLDRLGRKAFAAYAAGWIRSLIHKAYRNKSLSLVRPCDTEEEEYALTNQQAPGDDSGAVDVTAKVRQAIRRLRSSISARDREILRQKYLHQRQEALIAKRFSLSKRHVQDIVARCRLSLQQSLRHCLDGEDTPP